MEKPTFRKLFALLEANIATQDWWPAESRFEIVVGAILTQNTAWTNVEKAIARLKKAGVLLPEVVVNEPVDTLTELIRPAGYPRAKAAYLQAAAAWFLANDGQSGELKTEALRASLLAVRGIGPETADDILLYCYQRPVFIWDTYARRFLAAAGWGEYSGYEPARRALSSALAQEGLTAGELAHFHGLIVDGGKEARRRGGWEEFYPRLVASPQIL